MAKALKCDRCGGFYDLLKDFRDYRIVNLKQGVSFEKNQVDLCPDCYAEFLLFLNLDNGSVGSGELYPEEFESKHYEFEDCDNIKGERVIKCREESDGSSSS